MEPYTKKLRNDAKVEYATWAWANLDPGLTTILGFSEKPIEKSGCASCILTGCWFRSQIQTPGVIEVERPTL